MKLFSLFNKIKIFLILLLFDQYIKYIIIKYFIIHEIFYIKITDFFNIVYYWNKGISFGLFQNFTYGNLLFTIINSVVCLYLFFILINSKYINYYISYNMILSGAVSNICDRLLRGAVFDFIMFHYDNKIFFPIFNLSDVLIFSGIMHILYYKVLKY